MDLPASEARRSLLYRLESLISQKKRVVKGGAQPVVGTDYRLTGAARWINLISSAACIMDVALICLSCPDLKGYSS